MTRLIKGHKYYLKWWDAQSESKWQTADEILKTDPAVIEAVYHYVGKGKAGYCFAGEYNDGEFGNSTIIPSLSDIKSIRKI